MMLRLVALGAGESSSAQRPWFNQVSGIGVNLVSSPAAASLMIPAINSGSVAFPAFTTARYFDFAASLPTFRG